MLLLLLAACDGSLTHIAVSGQTSTSVPAGTVLEALVGDLGFGDFTDMDLTTSQELKNQGVKPGDITSAVLTDFSLHAKSGDPDLSFLTSMRLRVQTDTLDALTIASQDHFPEGEDTVDFETTGTDIAEYVTSQAMTLTTDVDGHRPESDTVVVAAWVVDVGVTTQGAVSNL